MADHDAFLRRVKQKISPGGVIVGSVPNVRYFKNLFDTLVLKDWDYKDAGILDRTHLRYFTLKSLSRSLRETGYSIDAIRAINPNIRIRSTCVRTCIHCLDWRSLLQPWVIRVMSRVCRSHFAVG